jgi:hypothetical protein
MAQEALSTGRRMGDKYALACAVFGLACLASDLADWHWAALLDGAAQTLLDQTGKAWEAIEARYRRQSLAQARAGLTGDQFQQDYANGVALSFDQAINIALGRAPALWPLARPRQPPSQLRCAPRPVRPRPRR